MRTSSITATIALACLTATGVASATAAHPAVDNIYSTGSGLNMAIPDDDANGISSTISISDNLIIDRVAVFVSMDHTYVGDLIFTLTGPDGTTVTLADRPGSSDPDDFGDSSNLSADHGLIFGDRFFGGAQLVEAENIGRGCAGTDDVVGVDCARWIHSQDSLDAAFAGLNIGGDWTLSISDNAALDTGALNGWMIAFQTHEAAVPLPAGVWLFASGLFGLIGLRRKRAA